MKKKRFQALTAATLLALASGCGTTKEPSSVRKNPYERKPITEVSQHQLEADSRLIDAKTQQLLGNDENALAQWRSLTASDSNSAVAHYELGKLMLQNGAQDSALAHLKRAVEIAGDNIWYQMALAELYEYLQDGKHLVETWEGIVKLRPEVMEYHYELSNAYLKNNDILGAIGALNEVEKIIGVSEPITMQKKKLWEAIGKNDRAIKEVEALSAAMPKEKKYNAILAEMHMRSKRYSKAKYYYDRILASDSTDEYIHISLANYYKLTGQPERAFEEMKQGFLNPRLDGKSKLQVLGSFYTDEEFYGSQSKYAFELLDIAMRQCTDSLTYALFYGDVLMRQGKYAEAAHQFKLHLSQDSSLYEVWEALLICQSEIEDNEAEMLDYARRAEKLFPLHILPYYLQAFMSLQHGDYEEAARLLEQCVKLGFNKGYLEAESYALLADTYHELRRDEESFAYYERYLALRPDDLMVANNYAYFLCEAGQQLEKALTLSARTIEQEPANSTYLDTYAWILHKLSRNKEALEYIQQAIRHDKEQSTTLLQHREAIQKALQQQ